MKYTGEWHMIKTIEDLPEAVDKPFIFCSESGYIFQASIDKDVNNSSLARFIRGFRHCGRIIAWTELPLPEVKDD